MWRSKLSISVVTAGVAATLLAAAAGYGKAAPQKNDKPKDDPNSSVGYVDLNSISDEIKKTGNWQKMVQKATETRQTYSKELDDMVQRRHLTEAENKDLDTLRAKPKASDAETKRISDLLKRSDALDTEFNELANISSDKLTPQQQQRLQELSKLRAEAGQKLSLARNERERKLQELESQMLTDMQNRILKVVGDVAKGQNVGVVIDKQALLFGGRDLTSQVVQKLPKE